MAVDYFEYNNNPEIDFLHEVSKNNKLSTTRRYYINGETGYESFYTDVQGFWRQLYDPSPKKTFDTSGGNYTEEKFYRVDPIKEENLAKYYIFDDKNNLFKKNEEEDDSYDAYYTLNKDLQEASELYRMGYLWNNFIQDETFSCDYFLKPEENSYVKQKIDDNNFTRYKDRLYMKKNGDYVPVGNSAFNKQESHYLLQVDDNENFSSTNFYWHKNVVLAPQLLNFWMDFYQGEDTLSQYKISSIGDRPKVVNDSKITSVYFREIPKIIFVKKDEFDSAQIKTGYTYIYLTNEMGDLFSISTRGKSAE
jgi:hypothetical protein